MNLDHMISNMKYVFTDRQTTIQNEINLYIYVYSYIFHSYYRLNKDNYVINSASVATI